MKVRWLRWRNAVLADARFRDWAARAPFTRGVARARASEAFDLVAGFVYSQVLAASVECGLFEVLAAGPVGDTVIAERCGLPLAAAERLLRAAAALRLAEPVGGGWMLGRVGVAVHADPGVMAMVRHHRLLYADLADPLALLRRDGGGAALAGFWPYATGAAGEASDYSQLMAASQPMVVAQALAAFDFRCHRRMLDVGGGSGAFASAVGAVAPTLHRAVFDLPQVVAAIVDPAIERHAGSFATDALPPGYDLITLVRILHDHDDALVARILRAARAALPPGGRLLIVEPMAESRATAPMADAYFGMYLLAMGSGRARTPATLRGMLHDAGFARSRRLVTPLPLVASAIVASD